MKKIYTLIALFSLSGIAFAQWVNAPQLSTNNFVQEPLRPEAVEEIDFQTDRGDFLWQDDFEDPSNWEITNLGDFGWVIGADNLGWFFANPINSISDGSYAFVWNGDPGGDDEIVESLYTLTLADPIDVSGVESAILNFNLYGARFTDSFLVQVSNDGSTWTTIGDLEDIEMLTQGGGSVTANSIQRPYNITSSVAGQDDLWVQFVFEGGIAYGYMIDDVRLEVPLDHDVRINEFWTGDIINDYEYRMIPQEQVIPLYVGASTTNFGSNEEEVSLAIEVLLEGVTDPVFTGTSPSVTVTQGQQDTIWWDTGFIPEDIGEYTVNFEILTESEDGSAGDDTGSKTFQTTDFIWGNDNYDNFSGQFTGAIGEVTATDEWVIGTAFQVSSEGSFWVGTEFRLASGTDLSQEIGIALYLFIGGTDFWELVDFNTTFYQLVSGDQTGFTRVDAEEPIELEIGNQYLLAIQHQGGEGTLRIRGNDAEDDDFSTWIFGDFNGDGERWFTLTDFSPTIRMGLDGFVSTSDITEEAKLALLQNFPNPFSDATTIPYSLDKAERVSLKVFDIAGKEVMNVEQGVRPAGNHQIELNGTALQSGIYFYTLTAGENQVTKKMTVQ